MTILLFCFVLAVEESAFSWSFTNYDLRKYCTWKLKF